MAHARRPYCEGLRPADAFSFLLGVADMRFESSKVNQIMAIQHEGRHLATDCFFRLVLRA
jgi:hypothetical protein